jgi:3-polyprenyl-4-hydroxybenzoate decarboxylase
MSDMQGLAILGVIGLFGNTLAVVVQAIMNAHYARVSLAVSKSTHKIVNNQRTQMLRLVASLSAKVATLCPDDTAAQIASIQAEEDAQHASDAEK